MRKEEMKKMMGMYGISDSEMNRMLYGARIRKDREFCKVELRILESFGILYLQESHCGYGNGCFWTDWNDEAIVIPENGEQGRKENPS